MAAIGRGMSMESPLIAGRYQVTKQMARLGEAEFFAAVDTTNRRAVTLRTMNVNELGTVGVGVEHMAAVKIKRKVENEMRVVGQLDVPGLLALLDHGFDDPIYYQVYPPFVFNNLQMEIERRGRIPLAETLDYMVEIATTLAALHGIGIIHCDLSADNILLLDGHARIIDLSSANQEEIQGAVPGNPPYMSPEAIGGAKPSATRDCWALGVTMVYALTGELPFGAIEPPPQTGVPRLLQRILRQAPKPLAGSGVDLPPRLITLINNLLEKEPQKRIGDMRQVAAALRDILNN
jgi:serine/threonine-protein kinase